MTLRWFVFAPDGTYVGWQEMLAKPAFWALAALALLIPLWRLPRRRYALVSWAIFWALSVLTITGNGVHW